MPLKEDGASLLNVWEADVSGSSDKKKTPASSSDETVTDLCSNEFICFKEKVTEKKLMNMDSESIIKSSEGIIQPTIAHFIPTEECEKPAVKEGTLKQELYPSRVSTYLKSFEKNVEKKKEDFSPQKCADMHEKCIKERKFNAEILENYVREIREDENYVATDPVLPSVDSKQSLPLVIKNDENKILPSLKCSLVISNNIIWSLDSDTQLKRCLHNLFHI
jgi:hypothetical protein